LFHAPAVALGQSYVDICNRRGGGTMHRCTYCREETDVTLWVFDGVSDYPVPACQACRQRLDLRVFRVEIDDGILMKAGVKDASVDPGAPDPGAEVQPT
jgi:hypothetical protein